jgi:hypothetical protein
MPNNPGKGPSDRPGRASPLFEALSRNEPSIAHVGPSSPSGVGDDVGDVDDREEDNERDYELHLAVLLCLGLDTLQRLANTLP